LASPNEDINGKGRGSEDKGMEGGKTGTFSWREAARNLYVESDLAGGRWLLMMVELWGFGLMRAGDGGNSAISSSFPPNY
jgi:hypothetical protein